MKNTENQNSTPIPLILIVDDDPGQSSLLASFLKKQGFHVTLASSGEEALEILNNHKINMMISDVRMPGMSGLDTLKKTRLKHANLPVLMVTAYPDIRDAVGAMKDGAVNYLEKPIDLDELLSSVYLALGNKTATDHLKSESLKLPASIIAESPQMKDLFMETLFVASTESRVLITGESGTGKEIVAEFIHKNSPRSSGPLVKVNCAAIPDTLLESELFGHEKGAFTGAAARRLGQFEEANNGTVLLDEIGEMSPSLQAKILRVLQDGSYQRLGSNTSRHTNARILATTNRNLEADVKKGSFREDLFFRLNVFEIYVPSLRERPDDIIPMANYFVSHFSKGKPRFSPAVVACFELYHWPGNVRELKNAMERAALLARGEMILPEHLPNRIAMAGSEKSTDSNILSQGKRMNEIERAVILQTLRENNFNRTETARALGISRRALLYKLKRFQEQGYNIESE